MLKHKASIAAGLMTMMPVVVHAACDPHASSLQRAEMLNQQGNFRAALSDTESVLKSDPDDFHANYVKGTILFDQAQAGAANRWNPPLPLSPQMAASLTLLKSTAKQLPTLDRACVRSKDYYAILNTIGAFYLNRGYFGDAETFLLQAYAHKSDLSGKTLKKTLDNLGLLYLVQTKREPAIKYYTEGLHVGSTIAAYQLPKAEALHPEPVLLADTIPAGEAASHVGQRWRVEGPASQVHTAKDGKAVFVDIGGTYPHNDFTAVVFASDMNSVGDLRWLTGKTVDVSGVIQAHRGKPQIVVTSRDQIVAQ